MAAKPQQKPGQSETSRKIKKNQTFHPRQTNVLIAVIILVITWIVLSPLLSAGFINWDDPSYIQYNEQIKSFEWSSVKSFFSTYFLGNYHPLTLLVYSIEYSIFGDSAKAYHLMNLLFHIANTFLVFIICSKLFKEQKLIPPIVALLFGIHPMHIESVAWISELKDLLYTFFLLISINLYLIYGRNRVSKKFLLLSLLAFAASLLSKGQAVVLPLLLILIDFYQNRKFEKYLLLEKIPFLLLSLIVGIIAILAQENAVNEAGISLGYQVLFRFYAFVLYLVKSIVPFTLSGFHPFPITVEGTIPWFVYLFPVITLVILFLLWKARNNTLIIFGALFFITSLLPILLIPVGKTLIAERYTYVPYLGLFVIIAGLADTGSLPGFMTGKRQTFQVILGIVLIIFGIQSYMRSQVWKDSKSFWSDVLEKYPSSLIAREHLSMYYYYETDDIQSAISEMESAVQIDPSYEAGYRLAGFYYQQMGDNQKAIDLLSKAIQLDTNNTDALLYRGNSYKAVGNLSKALNDYSDAIKKSPGQAELWMARGTIYLDSFQQNEKAISDYLKAYSLDSTEVNNLYNLSLAYYKNGNFVLSLQFADKALFRGNTNSNFLKALNYYKLNDRSRASFYADRAKNAGIEVPDSLFVK